MRLEGFALEVGVAEGAGGGAERCKVGVEEDLVGEHQRHRGHGGRAEVAEVEAAPEQRTQLAKRQGVLGKRRLAREVAR